MKSKRKNLDKDKYIIYVTNCFCMVVGILSLINAGVEYANGEILMFIFFLIFGLMNVIVPIIGVSVYKLYIDQLRREANEN